MSTIRDVAKEANVSIGTVSRYLNGIECKEKNKINIQKAIKKLNYRQNYIAKGLRNNKSLSIGVLINSLTDVFATTIVSHLEKYIETQNYSMLLCDFENSRDRLEDKIDFLISRSVDGIVMFHLDEYLEVFEKIKKENIPLIVIDSPIEKISTDVILVDNYNSSYNVVKKLYEYGHKNIGIISGTTNRYIGKERFEGYKNAMKDFGIYNEKFIFFANYDIESGYYKTKDILKNKKITALYTTNYYMTLGALQAINEMKLNIPNDISIIGFDYFKLSDIFQPKITVVKQPLEKMGIQAGKKIIEKIKNNSTKNDVIEFNTELIWRESVKKIR